MREYKGFRVGNVLTEKIIHFKKDISISDHSIEKAYYAGLLTENGTLVMEGIGNRGGTNWALGTELQVENTFFSEAIEALTWFTNIYNKQKKNQGKTIRKKCFALTQLEEILPLLDTFGLRGYFDSFAQSINEYDKANELSATLHREKSIFNYQSNTMRIDLPLKTKISMIRHRVVREILKECQGTVQVLSNAYAIIQNAFSEGQRGLVIGSDDLEALRQGQSIVSRYDYSLTA